MTGAPSLWTGRPLTPHPPGGKGRREEGKKGRRSFLPFLRFLRFLRFPGFPGFPHFRQNGQFPGLGASIRCAAPTGTSKYVAQSSRSVVALALAAKCTWPCPRSMKTSPFL